MHTQNPVIGAVLNDDRLTIIARVGNWFANLAQHDNVPVHEAVNLIFEEANRHRAHAAVYTGGNGALHLVAAMSRTELLVQSFQWLAPVSNPVFANNGSEQFTRLAELVQALAVKLPKDEGLARELVAFARDESTGKIRYASPEAVAPELGHYPARAFALLLANQPEHRAPMAQQTSIADYQPF